MAQKMNSELTAGSLEKVLDGAYTSALTDPHLAYFLSGLDVEASARKHAAILAEYGETRIIPPVLSTFIIDRRVEDFHARRFIQHAAIFMSESAIPIGERDRIFSLLDELRGDAIILPDSVDWMKDALGNDFVRIHRHEAYSLVTNPITFSQFISKVFYLQWAFDHQANASLEATVGLFNNIGVHPNVFELGFQKWTGSRSMQETPILLNVMDKLELRNECKRFFSLVETGAIRQALALIEFPEIENFVSRIFEINGGGNYSEVVQSFAFIIKPDIGRVWKTVFNHYVDPTRAQVDELIGRNGMTDEELLRDWEGRLNLLRPAIGASYKPWIEVQAFAADFMDAQSEIMDRMARD